MRVNPFLNMNLQKFAGDGAGGGSGSAGAGAGAGAGSAGDGAGAGAGDGAGSGGAGDGAGSGAGTGDKAKTPEEIKVELQKEFEAEADRRVSDALKKREKALRDEYAEKERKAKLSEEQLKKEEDEKKATEQAKKDAELNLRALKLDLVDVLSENNMDLRFRDLISIEELTSVEAEKRMDALKEKVTGFKKVFDELLEKRVEEAKTEFLKGETPKGQGGKGTPPTAYEQAKAKGDVKGMLKNKFAQRNAQ